MTVSEAFVDTFRRPARSAWFLRNVDPLHLIVTSVAVLIPVVVIFRWQASAAVVALFLLAAIAAGVVRRFLGLFWKLALLLGVFFFAVRALFLPGAEVLWTFGPIRITGEGVRDGITMAALMIAVGAGILFLVSTIPPRDLALSMVRAGAPHTAAFVVLSTIQSVTDLGRGVARILDSQRARGIETDGNVFVRARAFVPTLAPLFLSAIVSAEERAIAMDARGFSIQRRRTSLRELRRIPGVERVAVVAIVLAAATATVIAVIS